MAWPSRSTTGSRRTAICRIASSAVLKSSSSLQVVTALVTAGASGTRYAMRSFFAACRADPSCCPAGLDLAGAWRSAIGRLRAHPITDAVDLSGASIPVVVDAGKLLRFVRDALSG